MINYDSILSAFDGKPTLLQWLKMVKKALDESILKNINIAQNGQKVVFTFNFEDGTSISTPEVTLPKGDAGVGIVRIESTNTQVVGDDTETNIRVELSDGSIKQFKTYAKNGVSITGIEAVGDRIVGDRTLTTLRANYSNNTSDEFVVTAKNGAVIGNIYLHSVKISNEDNYYNVYFNIYSKKENLTLEDALSYIPTFDNQTQIYGKNKAPVCFDFLQNVGVVSAIKYQTTTGYAIIVEGGLRKSSDGTFFAYSGSFDAKKIEDILIGEIV